MRRLPAASVVAAALLLAGCADAPSAGSSQPPVVVSTVPPPAGTAATSSAPGAATSAPSPGPTAGGSASPGGPGASGPAAIVSLPDDGGWTGAVLDDPYPTPAGTFTDTSGKRYDWARPRPARIVFFGYTHCPDICNTVMADVASALRRVDPAVRERTEVVFVTTDPARDTPSVIRRWLDRFDSSFVGLTATLPTIERAAAAAGVALDGKQPLAGGGYEVGHGTQLIGFTSDGKGRIVWVEGTPVGGLRSDITRLAG